jgi:hypothetical protein
MSIRMSNSDGAACIWRWRQASNLDLEGCLSGFRVNATGPHGSGWLLPTPSQFPTCSSRPDAAGGLCPSEVYQRRAIPRFQELPHKVRCWQCSPD